MQWLHSKGNFTPKDIATSEPMKLVEGSFNALSKSITLVDGELTPSMKHSLANDIFIFSGFKTMHQLKEASLMLSDDKGQIKSFNKFLQDVKVIDKKYNQTYLRAEYDFAVGSVTMAAKWESFDDSDRYNLQYRTASDGKARSSHQAMHNLTLPKSHEHWKKYYPPNDWGCRCTAMEVLNEDYETTDTTKAKQLGSYAISTAGKKGKMFEFNAGIEKRVFPPKHPYYTCRKMDTCNNYTNGKNAICEGCKILNEVIEKKNKNNLNLF